VAQVTVAPPRAAQLLARRALEARERGPARAGTAAGLATARAIADGRPLDAARVSAWWARWDGRIPRGAPDMHTSALAQLGGLWGGRHMRDAARRAMRGRPAAAPTREANPAPPWPPAEDIVYLGRALDVQVQLPSGELREVAWRGAGLPALAWAADARTLYVFPLSQRPRDLPADPDARAVFRRFHGVAPAGVVELPARPVQLSPLGAAVATGYRSRKWGGRPRSYQHAHGRGVQVYAAPGARIVALRGGRLRVTAAGIEG